MINFFNHNLKLHEMIDIHSKYDNMHKNEIFYDLICMNNCVTSCINYILSPIQGLGEFFPFFSFSLVDKL